MDFKQINELPDYLDFNTLNDWFQKVLAYSESINEYDYPIAESIADAFYELAIRQWHLYKLIDTAISERIDKWIKRIWYYRTADLVETICGIILMLGIKNSLYFLKQSLNSEKDANIECKIKRTITEMEERGCHPYWSLRK